MIKQLLGELRDVQSKIKDLLKYELADSYTDEQILTFIGRFREMSLLANISLVQKMVDYFQLLNEERNFGQIELSQIGDLYNTLIALSPFDVSLYESLYHFYDNVLDDSNRGKQLVEKGLLEIEHRLNILKNSFS